MSIIECSTIGFDVIRTPFHYVATYKNGKWSKGRLSSSDKVTLSIFSPALHYGQEAFEGMKAYRTKDNELQLFRPYENAKRFQISCQRIEMPPVPLDMYVDAVKQTVKANSDFVPTYGGYATLYVRPMMIGVGAQLSLKPAKEYLFMIICTPVGCYFPGALRPIKLTVTDYDRAAPHGTGYYKIGGNYAAGFLPTKLAKQKGYDEPLYLDPATHTKIDELGAANFFAINNQNQYVAPKSDSVLPSITQDSLKYIAKHYLHLDVIDGDILINELDHYKEAAACGTAFVVAPVGVIEYHGHIHTFGDGSVGPISKELYRILTGIQFGQMEPPPGWIEKVN